MPAEPIPGSASDFGGDARESSGFDSAATDADRSVIVTGWATIVVESPADAASEAIAIAERTGGRVDARSERAPTEYDGGSATVTLRIPSDALSRTLEDIKALGEPQTVSLSSSDVTMAVRDLEARITSMRASIERLTALLAEADSTEALIQLETAIADRQAQLESMEAEQRWYEDQVSMSTVTIDFLTEPTQPEPEPGSFLDGLQAGWEALVAFLGGLLIALGAIIPWLIPIGIVVLVVWLIVRAARRRRARRIAAANAAAATPVRTPGDPSPSE